MNELNKIRIARLNKITKANKAKDLAVKKANETARTDCIKRIKESWIPRIKELGEVYHAYYEAFPDAESITIPVGDKGRFEKHWLERDWGFAISTGDTDYYTLLPDGRFIRHCHYTCSDNYIPQNFVDMSLGMATAFLDGFERWEKELYRRIDARI